MKNRIVLVLFLISCFTAYNSAQNILNPGLNRYEIGSLSLKKHSGKLNVFFKDTTDECSIMLKNGTLLQEARLLDANDTEFTLTKNDIDKVFPISQIHKITFEHHGFWKGFAYGAATSVAFWGIFGLAAYRDGDWFGRGFGFVVGLVLAVPTGLVSGLITEFATADEVYYFGKINPLAKSRRLINIIQKHKK